MKITPKFSFRDGKSVVLNDFAFSTDNFSEENAMLMLSRFFKEFKGDNTINFTDSHKEIVYHYSDISEIRFVFTETELD